MAGEPQIGREKCPSAQHLLSETMRAMRKLVADGHVRSAGVSSMRSRTRRRPALSFCPKQSP